LCAFGPAVAVCDELLQFISARAPRVTDVLLDCGGYACGAAIVFGLAWLWSHLLKPVLSGRMDVGALGFLLIEGLLYYAILTVGGTALIACMYASVVLCFGYVLLRVGKRDVWLVAAMACTVGADFFLVVSEPPERLYGMLFFLAAQLLYAVRLHRTERGRGLLILRIVLNVVAVGAALLVLREKADALALVSMSYYANLIANLLVSAKRFSRDRLLCIGFVLFLLCDTVIGLQVAAEGYLSIAEGSRLYALLYPGFNLAWLFYLPSQVCIALSGQRNSRR
jgi:uncharacterized membrane protein YhhN